MFYKCQSDVKTLLKVIYSKFKAIQNASNAYIHCLSTTGKKKDKLLESTKSFFRSENLNVCVTVSVFNFNIEEF